MTPPRSSIPLRRVAATAWALAALAANPLAAHAESYTDLWDLSQGASVLATSPLHPQAGSAGGLFGGSGGQIAGEAANTLFEDVPAAGTVHSVEWTTATPIALSGYSLLAFSDGPSTNRAFSSFSLYAWDGTAYQPISQLDTATLYDAGRLDTTQSFSSAVIASRFKAEFVQSSTTPGSSGPRITELDAVATAVPEPSSAALLLLGLGALVAWQQRHGRAKPAAARA